MELRSIKLMLSLVIIIFVLFISQSAFATAIVNISAYIRNLQVTPINPDQPDFYLYAPDPWGHAYMYDSMGNEAWGGGEVFEGSTPYGYIQGKSLGRGPFEINCVAIANLPNMWTWAHGWAQSWIEVYPITEEYSSIEYNYLISFDYGFSVFGYSDSYGHFDSSFVISLAGWSISDNFSGTNEIIDESYAGHIDGIPIESLTYFRPWVETYAYAENIPEPTTMLLLGSGLIGLAGYGRKKFFKK